MRSAEREPTPGSLPKSSISLRRDSVYWGLEGREPEKSGNSKKTDAGFQACTES